MKVHALDGSRDVREARHEPKGRVVLIILAAGVLDCAALIEPANVDLSCTKGDLRLPWLVDLGLC